MKQGFEVWEKEQLRGDFEVLAVETAFSLALPSGRIFQGRIDRTIRYRGRLYVGDFKTTGRMGAYYEQRFDPSNQMTGYCWALQKLSGETPAGVIIDTVYNTKKQGPTHHRGQVSRNQADIDAWVKTIEAEYDLIEMCHAKNSYPMNTASCFMYGECPYRQACLKGDNWKMIDHWLITQCIERVWDPLTMEATSSPE